MVECLSVARHHFLLHAPQGNHLQVIFDSSDPYNRYDGGHDYLLQTALKPRGDLQLSRFGTDTCIHMHQYPPSLSVVLLQLDLKTKLSLEKYELVPFGLPIP